MADSTGGKEKPATEAGFSKLDDAKPISYSRTGLADHCRPVASIGPVCQAFDSVDLGIGCGD
jgi:hypothetical protein